ncbi:DMP19 family protein [Alteraurantiacibacter aquimixticola]|uniref:DUF4375 domain-containing protein n=1 Tax=Alteraurantiacibacter aquimixticola TaxID=2489173 RepID=A0A4T3F2I5_9SPHN|nr:DUF4375 domain-containing protein [Alteraurantiacibacter aquimixticola]TIX51465.1 DUF4375 domain-containing protein [Alteraurantiacibacter aquimixticola]
MFGRKTATSPAKLPVIIIPQSARDSEKDYALPSAVVDYVNYVLRTAMFERTEIPPEAMQAYHVDYYIAQVNNGGHSQYVGNSGWHQYQIDDIRAGLAKLGIDDAIELYEDLCAFADSHPEEFRKGMDARGFGKFPEFFKKADKVFYDGLGDKLMKANRDWIASLDCLLVLPDSEIGEKMKGLSERNPLFEQRKREREEVENKALTSDPIWQACHYLGLMADEPLHIERWVSGMPTNGPEGVKGTVFNVLLADGRTTTAFMFPQFGVMMKPDSNEKGAPIPMPMVQEWVMKHTGEYLPPALWE